MTDLTNPIFNDLDAAREYLEAQRWGKSPICPHCGGYDKIKSLQGKAHRAGLYQCGDCRQQFTVTVGTVFERSKVPLNKWLLATHLLTSSKKGMSAHQIHRMIGVTYKTAWFMAHRIREAMKDEAPEPMGGPGGAVQADETYFGKVENPRTVNTRGLPFTKGGKAGPSNKRAVVPLVSGGKARTFHVDRTNAPTVRKILVENVDRRSELHTDESRVYTRVGEEFKAHKTVNHSKGEYVRKDGMTTNNVEKNPLSAFN